jgi:hypothetical protein
MVLSESTKRYLQIYTAVAFVSLISPMLVSYTWWPLVINVFASTWFIFLLKVRPLNNVMGRALTTLNVVVDALSILFLFFLALDTPTPAGLLTTLKIYLTLLGAILPFLMWLSLFCLFFLYRRK